MPVDPRSNLNKTKAVADYLERYGAITHAVAYTKFKTFGLPQIINRLRDKGMGIQYDPSKERYLLTTHPNNSHLPLKDS